MLLLKIFSLEGRGRVCSESLIGLVNYVRWVGSPFGYPGFPLPSIWSKMSNVDRPRERYRTDTMRDPLVSFEYGSESCRKLGVDPTES